MKIYLVVWFEKGCSSYGIDEDTKAFTDKTEANEYIKTMNVMYNRNKEIDSEYFTIKEIICE